MAWTSVVDLDALVPYISRTHISYSGWYEDEDLIEGTWIICLPTFETGTGKANTMTAVQGSEW